MVLLEIFLWSESDPLETFTPPSVNRAKYPLFFSLAGFLSAPCVGVSVGMCVGHSRALLVGTRLCLSTAELIGSGLVLVSRVVLVSDRLSYAMPEVKNIVEPAHKSCLRSPASSACIASCDSRVPRLPSPDLAFSSKLKIKKERNN